MWLHDAVCAQTGRHMQLFRPRVPTHTPRSKLQGIVEETGELLNQDKEAISSLLVDPIKVSYLMTKTVKTVLSLGIHTFYT